MSCMLLEYTNSFSVYCTPNDSCWPSVEEWNAFGESLGGNKLHAIHDSMYMECILQGRNPFAISAAAHGICMMAHHCAKQYCDLESTVSNLPNYTVVAETVHDVQLALSFANKHDILVSVKTTGHSYHGASTAPNSLLIVMTNFTKYGEVSLYSNLACT